MEVDGYELLGELGRGGAGTVYLARQQSLNRLVALKVVSTASDELADRLLSEARLLSELRHPNVVSVFDSGLTEGRPWYSMTYCGGGTLADIIQRDGRLLPGQTTHVLIPLADALAELHARGIVHRDVKPGNVLFDEQGHIYLGDLGIALDGKSDRVTTSGAVLGTIGYSAPEMMAGESPSPASDIFSLGVLAYESLSGERPFSGPHIFAVMDAIRSGRYIPLTDASPDCPPTMADLVSRALSAEPGSRPTDLRAWAAQLRAVAPPSFVQPSARSQPSPSTVVVSSSRRKERGVGDESRSPRVTMDAKRRRLIGIIATTVVVAVAALVATFAAVSTGGSADTAPTTTRLTPEVLVQSVLPSKSLDGISVSSVWKIALGPNGETLVQGETNLRTETPVELFTWDEIIPKELVTSALAIRTIPPYSAVIDADPILRFCLPLRPNVDNILIWSAPFSGTTPDQRTIDELAAEWSIAFDRHSRAAVGQLCDMKNVGDPPDTTMPDTTARITGPSGRVDTTSSTSKPSTTSSTSPPTSVRTYRISALSPTVLDGQVGGKRFVTTTVTWQNPRNDYTYADVRSFNRVSGSAAVSVLNDGSGGDTSVGATSGTLNIPYICTETGVEASFSVLLWGPIRGFSNPDLETIEDKQSLTFTIRC